jgi:D-alanyl-D-alanine carboxypeptidase (penicillin-binding protein 5/6)
MSRFLVLLATLLLAAPAFAQDNAPAAAPAPVVAPPVPLPVFTAKSYLLNDLSSRQVLVAQNIDERREPASLTKLMTAYVVFQALKQKQLTLGQMAKVSEKAWKADGSRMFIEPNRAVTIDELLHGMIIQSGNDAAIALAEAVAGTEDSFAAKMNAEAQRLGMKNTHFVNATGISHPQHYSSAWDISLLAAAIIRDFPEYYPLYGNREYRYNNVAQYNRNRLLWSDNYVDGMKTGFTEAAGYCLVASAKRGNRRLLSVVLGTGSDNLRAQESQKLLNFGYQFYDSAKLYDSNQSIAEVPVYKGTAKALKAGFTEEQYVTLPKGGIDRLKVSMETTQPIVAPVTRGQRVGTVRASFDGKPLASYPLYALEDVPVASWFGRTWDAIRLWFR